jgi:Icc-related predicted phosphoesterase
MKKHSILYTADLHGNEGQYKKLIDFAIKNSVDSVIIGGDITPKTPILVETQRDFIRKILPKLILPLKQQLPKANLFLMMGNDDCKTNLPLLEENDPLLYKVIQDRRLKLSEDFDIVGYPYVPITPFRLKDWEKFDLSLINQKIKGGYELQKKDSIFRGIKTANGIFSKFEFNSKIESKDSIQKDLAKKIFTLHPMKTIYVIHAPPRDTNLDQLSNGHIGSFAVRDFIEQYQPYVTLHGHIHETVDISGKFYDKIGKTLCLSPGNHDKEETLSVILLNLYDLKTIKRLKI